MTMIPEEVHDIEKKDVDDNISGSIRKTEYDRDVYFHLLATEMVDEYDEEKGYKFIKDKYPEFDHRLDKDVHRLSSNDVESFNFVENWDIDLDEEDDLVLDYFSQIDSELNDIEQTLGIDPEGEDPPSLMKSIPSAEYLEDMLACEQEVARMLYIFLHYYRFDRYESSNEGRDVFYRLASVKLENFISDMVPTTFLKEYFRCALEDFLSFCLFWL